MLWSRNLFSSILQWSSSTSRWQYSSGNEARGSHHVFRSHSFCWRVLTLTSSVFSVSPLLTPVLLFSVRLLQACLCHLSFFFICFMQYKHHNYYYRSHVRKPVVFIFCSSSPDFWVTVETSAASFLYSRETAPLRKIKGQPSQSLSRVLGADHFLTQSILIYMGL